MLNFKLLKLTHVLIIDSSNYILAWHVGNILNVELGRKPLCSRCEVTW